jgi:two-component system, NarL family, response regulator LiaR
MNGEEPGRGVAPIRVLVVDDQAIVRKGVAALLAQVAHIDVVGEAADGQDAVAQVRTLRPDVILMDLVMPVMDGVQAIEQIGAVHPEARILVLTSYTGDDQVVSAIRAGAMGYLLKDSEPAELVLAIEQLSRGEVSLHPSVAGQVLQELRRSSEETPSANVLTEREVAVLRQVAQGLSNREVAARLETTEATVKSHVSSILSKLHLANRVQATLYALQEGIASLEEPAGTPG